MLHETLSQKMKGREGKGRKEGREELKENRQIAKLGMLTLACSSSTWKTEAGVGLQG